MVENKSNLNSPKSLEKTRKAISLFRLISLFFILREAKQPLFGKRVELDDEKTLQGVLAIVNTVQLTTREAGKILSKENDIRMKKLGEILLNNSEDSPKNTDLNEFSNPTDLRLD